MWVIALFSSLGMCLSVSKCFQEDAVLYDKIVGGRKVTEHEFQWMASLQIHTVLGYFHTCGAVLINPEWLVTAAHCIQSSSTASYRVMIGSKTLNSSSVENIYAVKMIVVKGDFDEKSFENDISLIQIFPKVRNFLGVFPDFDHIPDTNISAVVVGWGSTSEGGKVSNDLQAAVVNIIPLNECQRYILSESMMCAGYLEGGIDACQGDSGGPLLQWINKQVYLMGIVSWGIGCAERDLPGVYTNVSLFNFWILHYIVP